MDSQTMEEMKAEMESLANELPLLPLPKEAAPRQLALGGEALKLEELGPIIINPDGTTRRITNWDTLTPQERATSWRLISARNKKRIEELKRQRAEAEQQEAAVAQSSYSSSAVEEQEPAPILPIENGEL